MGAAPAAAAADRRWMRAALALACRALGRVAPNPAVAALIVREGRLLGRGVTGEGGRPHAEALAIAQARSRWGAEALRGAVAYVTLEPCNHHGRTPPCTQALIDAGIARLVCPMEDPDRRVSGRGIAALRGAGIRVELGLEAEAARDVNAGFLSVVRRGRPWLTLKLATTLDGRIATGSGESRWITGAAARRRAHLMRARADAILVGIGTVLADDPRLDVRLPGVTARPLRIVADSRLRLDPANRLVVDAGNAELWVLHGPEALSARRRALEAAGVDLFELPAAADGRLDLSAALDLLGAKGVTRLLCEGGGTLAAGLLGAGLVDEIVLFTAGCVIGGDGQPAVGALGLETLAAAPRFRLVRLEEIGGDTLALWRPEPTG